MSPTTLEVRLEPIEEAGNGSGAVRARLRFMLPRPATGAPFSVDLCLMDDRGAATFAHGEISFGSNRRKMNQPFETAIVIRLPGGNREGARYHSYVLLRTGAGRHEFPPVDVEVTR